MTKFSESKFTVGGSKEPGAQQRYADSWERMFGEQKPAEPEKCGGRVKWAIRPDDVCVLSKGHIGDCWCNDGILP